MKNKFILILCLSNLLVFNAKSNCREFIDIVTYQGIEWHSGIVVKRIDLASKNITTVKELPFAGEIVTKSPIRLSHNNSLNLVISFDGEPCKNCEGQRPMTHYALLDDTMGILRIDSITNIGIFKVFLAKNDSLILEFSEIVNDTGFNTAKALFSISPSFSLIRNVDIPQEFQPQSYPSIAQFEFPKSIGNTRDRLFWAVGDYAQLNLLKLFPLQYRTSQVILAGDLIAYSQILGIDDSAGIVYVFSLSYDIPRNSNILSNRNNAPSFYKRYLVSNLTFVDSLLLPNIVPGSDYIRNETGQCEQIGPFFVYYFFASDDVRYFSPAMLFIFDTRTNQATWLRVGWR